MVYSGTTIYKCLMTGKASRGALVQFQGTPEVFMKTLGFSKNGALTISWLVVYSLFGGLRNYSWSIVCLVVWWFGYIG
jgi:hypothetical protein